MRSAAVRLPQRLRTRPGLYAVLVALAKPLALILALGCALGVVQATGYSAGDAGKTMWDGAFGSWSAIGFTSLQFGPLLLAACAVWLAMKAGLWNLGTVGQVYLGGLGAIVVALYVPRAVPGIFVVVLAFLAAFAFGAIWAIVPAVLKAYKGVTEIITTLLMTFLGQDLISYLVDRPPLGLTGAGYPTTATIIPARQLPNFGQTTRMNLGLIVAIGVTAMVVLLVARTLYGFQLRAFGLSTSTARSVGLASPRRTVQVLMVSGGIAGIGGAIEILGNGYALTSGFTSVDGFAAVAVALLGAGGGLQLGLATLFFAGLDSAAPTLKLTMGVPASIVSLTEGLVVVMLVVGLGLAGRLAVRLGDGSKRGLRGGRAVDVGVGGQQLPAAVGADGPDRKVEV